MKLTTALPRELRAELGIRDTYGEKKDRRNGPASRKDRRREERSGGRKPQTQVQQRPVWKKNVRRHQEEGDNDDEDMLDEGDESDEAPPAKKSKTAKPEQKPKSILKKSKPAEKSDESDDDDDIDLDEGEDEDVPAPRKVSKAVRDQLQEDDAEIAALEKRLGLKKGKKLPQSFHDDGLDDLLGDLGEGESENEGKKRKREADEWLQSKRKKAQGLQRAGSEDDDEEDDSDLGSDEEADLLDEDDDEEMDDEAAEEGEDSEFGGFDEEEEKPAPKKKENPFVAPVPQESQPAKYIPPSLRTTASSEDESLTRLRRQAQGQLNKLSEANMISILAEFEKLYREYPRQNVTSTLISLLMGLICERSALQDTFMILHAGFIAALYKVMGMDFGAELVQKIVQSLDAQGDERGKFEGKEHLNLISLISQLYNFHVIGHSLVFDYIRIFVQDITEDNTELLLKIIRSKPPPHSFPRTKNQQRRLRPSTPTR